VAHGLGRMMVTMSDAASIGRGIDPSVRVIAPCSYAVHLQPRIRPSSQLPRTSAELLTLARDQPPEWTRTFRGLSPRGRGLGGIAGASLPRRKSRRNHPIG
jgi:hypothetical protein